MKIRFNMVSAIAVSFVAMNAQAQVKSGEVNAGTFMSGMTFTSVAKSADAVQEQAAAVGAVSEKGSCAALAGKYVRKSCEAGQTASDVVELIVNKDGDQLLIISRNAKSEYEGSSSLFTGGKSRFGIDISNEAYNVSSMVVSTLVCTPDSFNIASDVTVAVEEKASGQAGGYEAKTSASLVVKGKEAKFSAQVTTAAEVQSIQCVYERK